MIQVRERGDVSTGELLGGRYRLQERIGEGGMARVYRADDEMLGRTVAVKIMRGPLDGLGAIERARSETRVLASLNHHGLVTLFDGHISEDDDSYLVMEFVEGITLQERIHRGAIQPAEAASLAVDIAEALHAAHSAGIVHRDIKPSNLLLTKSPLPGHEWRAKIADFGIACLQDSTRLTTPGIMVGTVAYIAPEQARGAAPAPAADIYALGLVLLETLTGTRPFADAEGIGAVVARLQGPPAIPDDLDEGWRRLIRGMTAMLPADRPTALEVAVAAAPLASKSAAPESPFDSVDEPTGYIPDAAPVRTTAVLPVDASVTAIAPVTVAHGAVAPQPALRTRTRRKRPRAILGGALLALIVTASIFGAVVWASAPQGVPEPLPSSPVEEMIEPSVAPTPADEDTATDDVSGDSGTDVPVTVTDDGNGAVNPGAGNGNGNGNKGGAGNNGNGKAKGKGKNG
ncbi:serine/threonine-protein kinase [Microbacterium pumilum]|uniref:non-specific serine/threonine protein kinase n=1 Tax=Microbacterium pumilum TaxID=344165 RepID=A0ABN2SZA2_9MICO